MQIQPLQLVPITAHFVIDEKGRPVVIIQTPNDKDRDYPAIMRSFLEKVQAPNSFPVVLSTANGQETANVAPQTERELAMKEAVKLPSGMAPRDVRPLEPKV